MQTQKTKPFIPNTQIHSQSSQALYQVKMQRAWATKFWLILRLAPASIYFKFYLHQALIKAGLGNDYLKWLDKWRENITMGLSTWAETSDVSTSRSDCHAWGSSPNIEFYRIILGIDSDAPGFSKIKISPHLGSIEEIAVKCHIQMEKYPSSTKCKKVSLQAEIKIPENTSGSFVWKDKSYALKGGKNSFTL